MNLPRTLLSMVAAAVLMVCCEDSLLVQAAETPPPSLFVDPISPRTAADREAAADPAVFRSRLVTISPRAVADWGAVAKTDARPYGTLVLNLFEDVLLTAVLEDLELRSNERFTWRGRIEGVAGSRVTIVMEDGAAAANIRTPDAYYQVRYVAPDLHAVRQIDETRYPPEVEAVPIELPPEESLRDDALAAADDGTTFDVMVVYTPASRLAAGGTEAMNALINLAAAETNDAYARSGVIPRLRLVHTAEVSYKETNNFRRDLERLTNGGDGFMDEVHKLRNRHGADLVSLIVEATSACGIAWVMRNQSAGFQQFAFNVVERTCAAGNFTFGHELGHNMGLQHDRADTPVDGVFPHSHGYVDTVNQFRTIMGVQPLPAIPGCCIRIQNFSNPDVLFGGAPTGVPEGSGQSANAAASLNAVRGTVANWRTQVNFVDLTVNLAGPGDGRVRTKGGAINCGADCSQEYRSGARVLLTAAPAEGSVFRGWSGACSGRQSCTVTMNADRSVTATFAPPLRLGPAALPGGRVGVAYSAGVIPAGGVPPYTVSVLGVLPGGLSLAGTNISGTPENPGVRTFTIRVTDQLGGTASRKYNLAIRKAPAP